MLTTSMETWKSAKASHSSKLNHCHKEDDHWTISNYRKMVKLVKDKLIHCWPIVLHVSWAHTHSNSKYQKIQSKICNDHLMKVTFFPFYFSFCQFWFSVTSHNNFHNRNSNRNETKKYFLEFLIQTNFESVGLFFSFSPFNFFVSRTNKQHFWSSKSKSCTVTNGRRILQNENSSNGHNAETETQREREENIKIIDRQRMPKYANQIVTRCAKTIESAKFWILLTHYVC